MWHVGSQAKAWVELPLRLIVASAFDSSLAPVGVLLAVLGMPYGNLRCLIFVGLMMQNVSGM